MILYHTSDRRIEHPDISFSHAYHDFGKGIYTTPNRTQAEKYAKRFFKEERPAFLNIFDLDDDVDGYTHYTFDAYDGDWLDYVVLCRRNQQYVVYDIVYGPIADDGVVRQMRRYEMGAITLKELMQELQYPPKITFQYFFGSEMALKKLKFVC